MSTGISVVCDPETEIEGYFQNLAGEFEDINFLLKKEDCDLSPLLHCPESFVEEDMQEEFFSTPEDLAYMKVITADDFHPIAEALPKLKKALGICEGLDDEMFEYGKEPFVSDLKELVESLESHEGTDLKIQLLRG